MEGLRIKPDGIYVDGTLGGAGHAGRIAARLSEGGTLIGIDRDGDALKVAAERLEGCECRVRLVKDNYGNISDILKEQSIEAVDGILLDLGVSSYQLDTPERGFSYMHEAPLDMRMDRDEKMTAADIVNGYDEKELFRIIRDYGEDKFAKNIAKNIVKAREMSPIRTTGELVAIIDRSIPMKFKRTGGHPAKRTFQAIRIELNRELVVLGEVVSDMIDALAPGGRLCIITFHSLEDRIVKNAFRTAEDPCICPKEFPVCVCGRISRGRVITRKPMLPREEELRNNSRSRSAKLRIFEKSL